MLYCFRNFLPRAEYERNLGLKVFFLFLSLSHSVLPINNARKRLFLIFLIFFILFLEISSEFSSSGRVWMEFATKSFFFSFSAYHIPIWLAIFSERGLLIFRIFLLLFSKFSSEFTSTGWVWTEFEAKIFFSLSQPFSFRFG